MCSARMLHLSNTYLPLQNSTPRCDATASVDPAEIGFVEQSASWSCDVSSVVRTRSRLTLRARRAAPPTCPSTVLEVLMHYLPNSITSYGVDLLWWCILMRNRHPPKLPVPRHSRWNVLQIPCRSAELTHVLLIGILHLLRQILAGFLDLRTILGTVG